MERDPDGGAAGDRRVVGPDDVGVPGSEGARRLRGDHVLGVFEANPEEYVAVSVSSADALRGVERVDLQLKHAGGENLENRTDRQAPAPQQRPGNRRTTTNLLRALRPEPGGMSEVGEPFLPSGLGVLIRCVKIPQNKKISDNEFLKKKFLQVYHPLLLLSCWESSKSFSLGAPGAGGL